MSQKLESLYFILLLLIICIFGLYIRFDEIKVWKNHKAEYFFENKPIYSEYDSYYFARLAENIKTGEFKRGEIDKYRFFPDNSSEAKLDDVKFYAKYGISGSFISYIWAYLSKWFDIPLEILTWYLIPIFAILVAIPIFFYLRDLGYPYAGLIGGLITISSPMYLARTDLMRLDHDILNLFFPIFIAYTFYKFFETSEKNKKYFWILMSSLFLILYQFWYNHPHLNFVLIIMFLVRYFWDKKLSFNKEDIIYISLLILPQIWYIYFGPIKLYKQVKIFVFNIKSPTSADILFKDFPNIFMSISELQKLTFEGVFKNVIFNYYLGILGLIGAFLVFIFNFRKLIFLFPFFGVGLLAFFSGARFTMYLAPFIGIGLGFLINFLFNILLPYLSLFKEKEKQDMIIHLIGTIFLFLIMWIQKPALGLTSYPKVFSSLVKDMVYLKNHTPQESIIWTWWDYGYAFQLYSKRPTFHDGGSQRTPKTYFIARSFTTSDPEEAWYITSFISNYGVMGIAKNLKKGIKAKELVEKIKQGDFSKKIDAPVYWVFTRDLFGKFAWIHYFGSYNFDTKKGRFGRIITPFQCVMIANNILHCTDIGAVIDLNRGVLIFSNMSVPINRLCIKTPEKYFEREFFPYGNFSVEIVKNKNGAELIFLIDPWVYSTLFNQMFILRRYDPKYFELVFDDFPNMVVYKVKSEVR